MAALIFNTATWTGSALTTTIGTNWATVASATPVVDVNAARQKLWDGSGIWPNALIVNRKVYNDLRNTTEIIDHSKSQGFMDVRQGNISEAQLATVFDLEQIIVAGSPKNTADEGLAITIAPIWSNSYAMLCKVARTSDHREPCISRVFHWGEDGSAIGGTIESYRDETVRSDIIRVRHDVDEKVMYTQAGHLLVID